jgi:hypothetical protein
MDAKPGSSPLRALLGGEARPLKVVNFPGTQAPVGLWVLRHLENTQARLACLKYVEKTLEASLLDVERDTDIVREETRVQVLFRALRDPEQPERAFAAEPGELRELLTGDQRDALWQLYLEWVDERSPIRRFQSAEEVDAFIDAVGKGSIETTTLGDYDIGSLLFALRRLATSTRPSSSGSSLSSALSTATPPADPDPTT